MLCSALFGKLQLSYLLASTVKRLLCLLAAFWCSCFVRGPGDFQRKRGLLVSTKRTSLFFCSATGGDHFSWQEDSKFLLRVKTTGERKGHLQYSGLGEVCSRSLGSAAPTGPCRPQPVDITVCETTRVKGLLVTGLGKDWYTTKIVDSPVCTVIDVSSVGARVIWLRPDLRSVASGAMTGQRRRHPLPSIVGPFGQPLGLSLIHI